MSKVINSPKKFVISTENYHQRLSEFLKNEAVINSEIILGINALKVPNNLELINEVTSKTSLDCTWPLGSICCGIAHFQALHECIRLNEPITIFEDDAILAADFDEKSLVLINQIDAEWDIIQWGFNWDSVMHFRLMGKEGPVFQTDLVAELDKFEIEKFKLTKSNSTLFPLVSSFGMHAYTVNPIGAQKILNYFPKISNHFVDNLALLGHSYWCSSLDMVLNSFYNTNNAFIAIPPLSYVVNDKTASAIWNPPT